MNGRVERVRLVSQCLRDNPLGDPHERDLFVYVPPETRVGQRFPVILVLPGYAGHPLGILDYSPWSKNAVERFDAQVTKGESPPAILVLPDCMTRWGGSQFLDSLGMGRYQTYLADEVIPFVDQHFATIPTAEARGAAGRSSGGFGALRLAMDRPGLLGALASHAGDAAFEVSMRPMFTSAAIALERAGGLAAFAGRLPEGGPRNAGEFDAAFVLAASAAYSPEPSAAFPHVALPFDPSSAELRPDVFARWLAHDPVERLASDTAAEAALRDLALVYLDAGTRDEHGLQFAARALCRVCSAAGVRIHLEEFEGGHRGTSHRYETSLPLLARALTLGAGQGASPDALADP